MNAYKRRNMRVQFAREQYNELFVADQGSVTGYLKIAA